MIGKKILILLGDFSESYEAMVPFQSLKMVGYSVHAICPHKQPGNTIVTAIDDFEGNQTYTEKRGHNFSINASFAEINEFDYDALVIPGGRAPEYLRNNERALEIIRHFANLNNPIAAICHAARLLAAADVIKGRKISAYPACSCDVQLAAGHYADISADDAIHHQWQLRHCSCLASAPEVAEPVPSPPWNRAHAGILAEEHWQTGHPLDCKV